jgi:hypothetical protein
MDNFWFFVAGIVVSVPFSILANLATPSVRVRLESRSEKGRLRNQKRADFRDRQLDALSKDLGLLNSYQTERLANISVLITAAILLVVTSTAGSALAIGTEDATVRNLRTLIVILSIPTTLLSVTAFSMAVVMWFRTISMLNAVDRRRAELGLPFRPTKRSEREGWGRPGEPAEPETPDA